MSTIKTSVYPAHIFEGVKKIIHQDQSEQEIDNYPMIESMTKVEVMDMYIESLDYKLNGEIIRDCIDHIYGIDVSSKFVFAKKKDPLKTNIELIDDDICSMDTQLSGSTIRLKINELFGINLDAIDALGRTRVSLFSKGQWIVRNEENLFEVHTGIGDLDVYIVPSHYYKEQTEERELPTEIQTELLALGYSYSPHVDGFYFSNPLGKHVEDDFKKRTMGTLFRWIDNQVK